jgi:hypothetical protein
MSSLVLAVRTCLQFPSRIRLCRYATRRDPRPAAVQSPAAQIRGPVPGARASASVRKSSAGTEPDELAVICRTEARAHGSPARPARPAALPHFGIANDSAVVAPFPRAYLEAMSSTRLPCVSARTRPAHPSARPRDCHEIDILPRSDTMGRNPQLGFLSLPWPFRPSADENAAV